MYRLAIKKSARKELDNLPDNVFLKIDIALLSLKKKIRFHTHSPENLKAMKNAGFVLGIIELFIQLTKARRSSLSIV